MRNLATLALLLTAAAPRGPCDLGAIQVLPYCPKCDKDLAKEELKKGKCVKCEGAVQPAEFCVKKLYLCIKGPQPAPCKCCKDVPTKPDRARVLTRCGGCGKECPTGGKCGEEVCRSANKKVKKACSRTGVPPHATP